jgi:hypothetical protein
MGWEDQERDEAGRFAGGGGGGGGTRRPSDITSGVASSGRNSFKDIGQSTYQIETSLRQAGSGGRQAESALYHATAEADRISREVEKLADDDDTSDVEASVRGIRTSISGAERAVRQGDSRSLERELSRATSDVATLKRDVASLERRASQRQLEREGWLEPRESRAAENTKILRNIRYNR